MAFDRLAILLGVALCALYLVEVQEHPGYSWLAYPNDSVLYRWSTLLPTVALWALLTTIRPCERRFRPTELVFGVDILHSIIHYFHPVLPALPPPQPSHRDSGRHQ